MGLDITAYRKVEHLETMDVEAWEEKYWWHEEDMPVRTAHVSHWEPAYADRAAPIVKDGVYKFKEDFHFHAGSYAGYNHWRAQLSRMALGVAPDVVWAAPEKYQGKPFVELINFSDCEGIVGAVAARKLAGDFAAYQEQADAPGARWFAEAYHRWRRAFELAADDGFVVFH